MTDYLPTIWLGIICVEIALYICLDGTDLGIGLLSLMPQEEKRRALMIHAIGPVWDANETWIVVAGGTLFGAFPIAYAILLNALYIPICMILFGFMLRAVSFEFRVQSVNKRLWGLCFGFGSLLAVLGQGFAVGGLLSGIPVENFQFAGSAFSWFSPLTIFITIGIVMSYVVVGYAYLLKKTDYASKKQTFSYILAATSCTCLAFIIATILLPFQHYVFFTRWTYEPTRSMLFFVSFLIATAGGMLVYCAVREIGQKYLHSLCITVFLLSFIGLLIGVYPYMLPPSVTIFQAASSPATLRFMLWGIGPLLPIIFAYNFYMYYVFRDKVSLAQAEEY